MKTRTILTLVCLAAMTAPAAGAAPLADRLPAGTLVYVGWAGRSLTFDGSMFGQLLSEPAVESILGAAKKAILEKVPKEGPPAVMVEKGWAMAAAAWQHPIALALLDISQGDSGPMPAAAVLIDLGKDRPAFDQNLNALIAALGRDFLLREETAGSVTYKVYRGADGVEIALGYMGDVFFASFGPGAAKQLVQVAPGSSLKTAKKFADCAKAVGGDNEQCAFYADVSALLEKVQKLMDSSVGAAMTRESAKSAEIKRIIDALGVGKVTAVAGSMQVVDRGMYSKCRIFSKAPHQGVLMPLAGGTLTDADLAGVPDDADYAAAVKLSPEALYNELRRVLKEIDPKADDEFARGISQAESSLGLLLTQDVLGTLGDTWVISSAPSQGGFITGTMLTVQVKDAAKLSATVAKIEEFVKKRMAREGGPEEAPGFERPRRSPGASIETLKAGGAEIHYLAVSRQRWPVAPAWAIHKDKLYVAAWPQVIQSAIEAGPEKPLTQDSAFRTARAKITGKPSALAYLNTPKVLRQVYNIALVGWTMAANELARHEDFPARPDWLPALPKIEKYLWPEITATSADAEGITFEGYSSIPALGIGLSPTGSPLAVAVLFPALARARSEAKTTVSASKLRVIDDGIRAYKVDNGSYPPDLAALLKDPYIQPQALVSPVSGHPPPTLVEGKLVGEIDYIYIRPPKKDMPADSILAYERLENYGGQWTNVLRADGAVMRMDRQTFEQELKKTQEAIQKASGK